MAPERLALLFLKTKLSVELPPVRFSMPEKLMTGLLLASTPVLAPVMFQVLAVSGPNRLLPPAEPPMMWIEVKVDRMLSRWKLSFPPMPPSSVRSNTPLS